MASLLYTYRATLAVAAALLIAGCASGGRGSAPDLRDSLVLILLDKQPQKSGDCAMTVKIENKTGTSWDGVSYNIALHDKRGVSAGRLVGSPRSKVKPGESLVDKSTASGFRCDAIAGAAPVYFGYYPTGKKQVTVHNANVRIRFD